VEIIVVAVAVEEIVEAEAEVVDEVEEEEIFI
jgi:hypothetical protein